jgi:hypothetical protein
MMLGDGKHRKAIASTLCEIHGMLPLVEEGKLDEVNYVALVSIIFPSAK